MEVAAVGRPGPDGKAPPVLLIVDDEFDIAITYAMLFEYHGFRVLTASNGREALATAATTAPDLVLSDYMMPVMDGAALCAALRADPLLGKRPFILLSAGGVPAGVKVDCDLFLKKPVAFDKLLLAVQRLLKAG
jgi:CheY-like chemotaxis protein